MPVRRTGLIRQAEQLGCRWQPGALSPDRGAVVPACHPATAQPGVPEPAAGGPPRQVLSPYEPYAAWRFAAGAKDRMAASGTLRLDPPLQATMHDSSAGVADLSDGTVQCRCAPDLPYAASTAASRSITIGHPARMPSNAVLPIGVSRSKPACSSDSRVPSPSGARDQVMTVFSTPGANA